MIHELRIYHCAPGRMPALLKRFDDDHARQSGSATGFARRGSGRTEIGANNHDLYYMLEWESLAEREARWDRVSGRSGVGRESARRAEKDGPILTHFSNMILKPTAFSKMQ